MKRLEANVYGHVQVVFFRDSTQRFARHRNIGGWVRNERDGSVRVVAEGPEASLRELEQFLRRGPSAARVERVEAEWDQATEEFNDFHVRY